MTDNDHEPDGEFTRFKANVQLGDGPDQRGDFTVEIVREPGEDRNEREVEMRELSDPEAPKKYVETKANDAEFAEFYHELQRGKMALQEALGLPDEE